MPETFMRFYNVNCEVQPDSWHKRTTMSVQELLETFASNIKDKHVEVFSAVLQGNEFNVMAAFYTDNWHRDHSNYTHDG